MTQDGTAPMNVTPYSNCCSGPCRGGASFGTRTDPGGRPDGIHRIANHTRWAGTAGFVVRGARLSKTAGRVWG